MPDNDPVGSQSHEWAPLYVKKPVEYSDRRHTSGSGGFMTAVTAWLHRSSSWWRMSEFS